MARKTPMSKIHPDLATSGGILRVTLNEDVMRRHLKPGTGYFKPTTEWDNERSWDRLWS